MQGHVGVIFEVAAVDGEVRLLCLHLLHACTSAERRAVHMVEIKLVLGSLLPFVGGCFDDEATGSPVCSWSQVIDTMASHQLLLRVRCCCVFVAAAAAADK
jgi:hypothetical protein